MLSLGSGDLFLLIGCSSLGRVGGCVLGCEPTPPLPSAPPVPVMTAMAGYAPARECDVDAPVADPVAHW